MASKDKKTKTKDTVEKIVNEVTDNDEWEALRINTSIASIVIRQEHLTYTEGFIVKTVDNQKTYYPTSQILSYTLLTKSLL